MIKNFLLSLSFISRIPINVRVNNFSSRVKEIPTYFPLVGYLVGIIYYFGAYFESLFLKVLFLTLSFYLFDLFHFDGLLDMFDGFFNQSSKEKRLEIMSKGDVGPFAVFFGTLYIIILWTLYNQTNPFHFIISSVLGRYSMVFLLYFSNPAKNSGLGKLLFPFKKKNLIISTLFTLPLMLFSLKKYVISFAATIFISYIISIISKKKIGGITGDVLGGTCLLTHEFVLLILEVV